VWKAAPPDIKNSEPGGQVPGTIIAAAEGTLTVATGDGAITLLDLQPAGKKKMDAGSFLLRLQG
jgi:methionyl-tRNA formyltransferase